MTTLVEKAIDAHIDDVAKSVRLIAPAIETLGRTLSVNSEGNKVLFAGNGDGAADAQHLAAEIVGRFEDVQAGCYCSNHRLLYAYIHSQ